MVSPTPRARHRRRGLTPRNRRIRWCVGGWATRRQPAAGALDLRLTCADVSHMLKPFSSLSSSLTSSAASGSNEDRRFTGRSVSAATAPATRVSVVGRKRPKDHMQHGAREMV